MSESLPTLAVKAVIRDGEERILFLQRNPAKRDSDVFDLAGGLIDEGEEPLIALYRELKEELGEAVTIEVGQPLGEWSFYRQLDGKTVKVVNYAARLVSGEIILSNEHIAKILVSDSEARGLPVKDKSIFNALS